MKIKWVLLACLTSMSMTSYADVKSVESALEQEDVVRAEHAFNALSAHEKNDIAGQVLKGRILLVNDESEEAFDYFAALQVTHDSNVDINYYLGVSAVIMAQKASIFSKLSYAKDFLKAMEKTVELKPDHFEALTTLIGFHLNAPGIAGGDTEQALFYAKQLQQYDAEQGYSQLAKVYWQIEKPDLAAKIMAEGLDEYPESGILYFARASFNIQQKLWNQAQSDLVFAVKYAKDDKNKSEALYQQGKVSAESGQQVQVGITALMTALPLADKQFQPWVKYRLAQLHLQQKQQAKASEYLAQIDIDSDDDLADRVKKLKRKLIKLTG